MTPYIPLLCLLSNSFNLDLYIPPPVKVCQPLRVDLDKIRKALLSLLTLPFPPLFPQVLCVGNLYNPDVRYSFNIPIEEHREQFVWDPSGSWLECNRICQGKISAWHPNRISTYFTFRPVVISQIAIFVLVEEVFIVEQPCGLTDTHMAENLQCEMHRNHNVYNS